MLKYCKINLFIFLILEFNFAFAEESFSPFDFANAYERIKYLNSPRKNECKTYTTNNDEKVLSCSVLDTDFDESVIIKIDYSPENFPVMLASALPDKFVQDTYNKEKFCIFRFKIQNDNQQMFRPNTKNSAEKYGDDYGRTHGLEVGVSCESMDGVNQSFTYSTELYSDPDRSSALRDQFGNTQMKQKFTSENIFALIQDNINQGQALYWKRGVGLINLSQKKKWGLLQSTGQQEWFHNTLNKIKSGTANSYQYIDGQNDQWGAFVILSIGLQENRKLGDRCKLNLSTELGGRISSLRDTSTMNFSSNARFNYQLSENSSIYLRAQSDQTVRKNSKIIENTIAAGIETKNGSYIEAGVMQQKGNRTDVPDLPNFSSKKNDKQIFLRIGKSF